MAKWGYVGWFPSEAVLVASMPADKCAGNFASIGNPSAGLTFYFSDGQIWMPGGSSLGNIRVPTGLDTTSFRNILQRVGTSTTSGAPWGVGREIVLPPGIINCPTINLPTGQSVTAPGTGVSVLKYAKHATVVAETALFKIPDDLLQKRGIHGRGVLRNMNIDGAYDEASHGFAVHGVWYDLPADGGDVHYMDNVTITKCTGSGVKVNGRDQFCGIRTKCGDNKRYGYELIDMNDSKLFAPGAQGNLLGAVYLEHCATPKFYGCDFGNPNSGFLGTWTVTMVNQARAMFCGGEIEGRVGILGRNDQSTNRWEMSGNIFDGINFKIDPVFTPPAYTYNGTSISATIYAEDVDGLTFTNCKLQYDDNIPDAAALAATPEYFIYIKGTTSGYEGAVKFGNMSNLVHRRSRPGEAILPMVCFTKHYCNAPYLIEWEGFTPGAFELIPYNGGVPAARPRNYLYCGAAPVTYNKADYPIGYLWMTLSAGGTLDDVNTTFDIPAEPSVPPAGYKWAIRVWP